jgi:hypothetical protein
LDRKPKLEVIDNVPVVECNVEIPAGSELVIFRLPDGEERVGLKREEYFQMMEMVEKILDENFNYRLEQEILKTFPIDFEDVKSVVLAKMEEDKSLTLEEAVSRVKREHPNLFHQEREIKFLNKMFEKIEEDLFDK